MMLSLAARTLHLSILLVAGVLLVHPDAAIAEKPPAEEWGFEAGFTPFQGSAFTPAQIFTPSTPVRGLRLNLIYGKQESVWGLDVGVANRTTSEMHGVQLGLLNWDRDFIGLQSGMFNRTDGDFIGLQAGMVNHQRGEEDSSLQIGARINIIFGNQGKLWGLDAGVFNITSVDMRGLQLGAMNTSLGKAVGLQLGWANWVAEDFTGAQLGMVNGAQGRTASVQLGFLNTAGEGALFQLGALNQAKSLKGVQIGLVNLNGRGQPFRFMPRVNVGW